MCYFCGQFGIAPQAFRPIDPVAVEGGFRSLDFRVSHNGSVLVSIESRPVCHAEVPGARAAAVPVVLRYPVAGFLGMAAFGPASKLEVEKVLHAREDSLCNTYRMVV